MNIEPNPSVATSARTRRTVLSVAIAVIATIPIADRFFGCLRRAHGG